MYRRIVWLIVGVPMVAFGIDGNVDSSFFKNAAEGGIAEVDAGKLAQEKGGSPAVREFGAMMVKDHSAANAKLQGIAVAQGVKLPTSVNVMQMASQKELQLISGDSFDKSYVKDQIKAPMELFKKEIATGKDHQARDFAASTLPTVQAHLAKIKQIATTAGIAANWQPLSSDSGAAAAQCALFCTLSMLHSAPAVMTNPRNRRG
jgi:putative membrane protein